MRSITLALLLFSIVLPTSSRADFFLHHWQDHYEPVHSTTLEGDLLDYRTNQNYDTQANTVSAPNSNSYKRLELDALGQFGISDRMSAFGRLAWASIQADNSLANGTSSGLTDQSIGGNYRVYETSLPRDRWIPISLDLQGQIDFPAYSNGGLDSAQTPFLGDASVDTTVGGFLTFPVWQNAERAALITAGAGYTFRSSHFSPQVPWTVTASTAPSRSGFLTGVSVFGTTSIKNDLTDPAPSGLATGSGGSFVTNAINPSLIVLHGEAGYQFEKKTQVLVAYEQSFWGENSPNALSVMGIFRIRFGESTEETSAYAKAHEEVHSYSLEAKVLKSNDRLNLVKIDKGSDDGVSKGQLFDLFSVRADGSTAETVARGQVTDVKSHEAVLTVIEYVKGQWIEEGFVAKRIIQ